MTTDSTPRIVTCPTCGRRVKWTQSNPDRPFCSERCKLIDLGAWADEQHSIPGDVDGDENDVLSGDMDER